MNSPIPVSTAGTPTTNVELRSRAAGRGPPLRDRAPRRGTTITELIVAMMLLGTAVSMIGAAVPRLARQRTLTSQRQAALQELSSQMEYLTSLDRTDLADAIERLELSREIDAFLPEAQLDGQLVEDDPRLGSGALAIRLQIHWNAWWGQEAPPLRLETWVYPKEHSEVTSDLRQIRLQERSLSP